MSSSKPQAREAAWYDEHYRNVQSMGPWYSFTIPDVSAAITPQTRLVEFGCGQGLLLRYLVGKKVIEPANIYAMDQSQTAVDFVRQELPAAHISVGDLYDLQYPPESFHICLLMETIEHLAEPQPALREIKRVMAPGGLLYVSFPNFLSLPWLAVRLLGDLLNKPNWLVRQPIDKIYTVFGVRRLLKSAGFTFLRGIGSGYGPPVLYQFEKSWQTNALNTLGLWWLSFHPILVFQKPSAGNP